MEILSQLDTLSLVQVIFWGFAGLISFYFSIGNARVWTSISIGFFLIFLAQGYLLNPYTYYAKLAAFHYAIGTVSIVMITHGFLEYFVFTRTFEISGNKMIVYASTFAILFAVGIFMLVNPAPSPNIIRNMKIVENAIWVFLAGLNIDLIRKIYQAIKDSPISKGFIAFGIVFVCIFFWKGSELYLQVFQWDKDWMDIIAITEESTDYELYTDRIKLSEVINKATGLLSGITVGGTFAYLFKLLR